MNMATWFWRAACAAAVVAGLGLASPSWADDKGKDKGKGGPKANIIQVDLNKLPPGLARQLMDLSKGKYDSKGKPEAKKHDDKGRPGPATKDDDKKKPGDKKGAGKAISLTEAIAIAEKVGRGQAVKAERKGEGADAQFKIDVVGRNDTRSKITLDAAGRVVEPDRGKGTEKKPGKDKKE